MNNLALLLQEGMTAAHPELSAYQQEPNLTWQQDDDFALEIPSAADPDTTLRVETTNGEIIVYFGACHVHIDAFRFRDGEWTQDRPIEEIVADAVAFVGGIVADVYVTIAADGAGCSSLVPVEELGKWVQKLYRDTGYTVRSWTGIYNQEVRSPSSS